MAVVRCQPRIAKASKELDTGACVYVLVGADVRMLIVVDEIEAQEDVLNECQVRVEAATTAVLVIFTQRARCAESAATPITVKNPYITKAPAQTIKHKQMTMPSRNDPICK